jgi:hypothetical protein
MHQQMLISQGSSGGGGPGAMPAFQAAGGTVTTTSATLSVPWPTHIAGDLGLCLVLSSNVAPTAPSGWVTIAQLGVGTANTALSTMLSVYGRIATSSSESTAAVGRSTADFLHGRILTIRGVDPTSYIDDSATGSGATSSTISLPAVTTTDINRLVVYLISDGTDSSNSARYNTWTNANLASVTERADAGTTQSNGGGIGAATGEKATAGAVGAGSVNFALSASNYAAVTLAIKPPNL